MLSDVLNSFVFYSTEVSGTSPKKKALITVIFFGILGLVLLVISLLLLLRKLLCANECKQSNCKRVKTLCFGIMMTFSTMAYFLGDNLENLVTTYPSLKCDPTNSICGIRVTVSSIYLLIVGIIGFRIIPLIEKRVKDICKACSDEGGKGEDKQEKIEDKYPFYTAVTDTLGIIAEVDAWYTAMTSLSKNNVLKSSCLTYIKVASWVAYVIIIIALLVYSFLKVFSFNKKKCDCKEYYLQYMGLTILMALRFIIIALYLLADNSEPFDCTFNCGTSTSKCSRHKDIVRFSLTLIVLVLSVIYSVLLLLGWIYKRYQEQKAAKHVQTKT